METGEKGFVLYQPPALFSFPNFIKLGFMLSELYVVKRPTTFNGRRIQAENQYNKLAAYFGTHVLRDWVGPDGKSYRHLVPPYCYRFDETFGVLLTWEYPSTFENLLNSMFNYPDSTDLKYLNDILFILGHNITDFYTCTKGSEGTIAPDSLNYIMNSDTTYRWVENAEQTLNNKPSENYNATIKPLLPLSDIKATPQPTNFFLNGYSVDRFTKLLIALGILNDRRRHASDSKPRNWRAAIEALRDNRFLSSNDSAGLYRFLVAEYNYPFKKRVIQDGFNAKSLDAQEIYKRANTLLRDNM
ncbi:hypothetical protein GCM10028822_41360 [Hymenobacter terrigena]